MSYRDEGEALRARNRALELQGDPDEGAREPADASPPAPQSTLERLRGWLRTPPPPARPARPPERNAPCWCGSGVKYKRCHSSADARGRRDDALSEEVSRRNRSYETRSPTVTPQGIMQRGFWETAVDRKRDR